MSKWRQERVSEPEKAGAARSFASWSPTGAKTPDQPIDTGLYRLSSTEKARLRSSIFNLSHLTVNRSSCTCAWSLVPCVTLQHSSQTAHYGHRREDIHLFRRCGVHAEKGKQLTTVCACLDVRLTRAPCRTSMWSYTTRSTMPAASSTSTRKPHHPTPPGQLPFAPTTSDAPTIS